MDPYIFVLFCTVTYVFSFFSVFIADNNNPPNIYRLNSYW